MLLWRALNWHQVSKKCGKLKKRMDDSFATDTKWCWKSYIIFCSGNSFVYSRLYISGRCKGMSSNSLIWSLTMRWIVSIFLPSLLKANEILNPTVSAKILKIFYKISSRKHWSLCCPPCKFVVNITDLHCNYVILIVYLHISNLFSFLYVSYGGCGIKKSSFGCIDLRRFPEYNNNNNW